jgi:hypothetical protein
MTTSTDLIHETTRHLYATARDPQNKLAVALSDTTGTSAQFTYTLGAIQAGAVLSVDLELMYVWAVDNPVTNTVTVERGYLGSTAATHLLDAIVTVNPKFPAFSILNAINEDLDDLSGYGLFTTDTVSVTYSPAVDGYDLTGVSNLLEVLEVKYQDDGPQKRWPVIKSWTLKRDSLTTEFASGLALVVNNSGSSGRPIRVTYSKPFTRFTALAQDCQSVAKLPSTANDLPPLGAALRLQAVREGQRNFNESQPATRRAQEVQTGAQYNSTRGLQELRRQRIRIEARRLQKFWPAKVKLPS